MQLIIYNLYIHLGEKCTQRYISGMLEEFKMPHVVGQWRLVLQQPMFVGIDGMSRVS